MNRLRFPKVSVLAVFSLLIFLSFVTSAPAQQPAKTPVMVNTALGPISPDQMGTTLVHEHFAFAYPGWLADATLVPYDRKVVLKTGLEVIAKAQKYGIKTIMDATPNDVGGRDH